MDCLLGITSPSDLFNHQLISTDVTGVMALSFLWKPAVFLAAASPQAAAVGDLEFNWFDLVVLILLGAGIWVGRKRGMSEEFLDLIQWLVIIVVAGMTNEPISSLFAQITGMGLLFSKIVVYVGTTIVIKTLFTLAKKSMGEKLVGSDVFGSMEYYLGMGAGLVRAACMILFFMAILNARLYTAAELSAQAKSQLDNFGSNFFPTVGSFQNTVFQGSFTGQMVKQHLSMVLIEPTAPSASPKDNIGQRRLREVNDAMGTK